LADLVLSAGIGGLAVQLVNASEVKLSRQGEWIMKKASMILISNYFSLNQTGGRSKFVLPDSSSARTESFNDATDGLDIRAEMPVGDPESFAPLEQPLCALRRRTHENGR